MFCFSIILYCTFFPVPDVLAYTCLESVKKSVINSPNKLVAVIVVDLTVLRENLNGGLKHIQFVLVYICGNIGS